MSKEPREITLLKATAAILRKCADSIYVVSPQEVSVFYDDADCDGSCLLEDIEMCLESPDLDTLQAENEALKREMQRYLPVIDRAEADPALWIKLTEGTGIATANGYRHALAKEPKA